MPDTPCSTAGAVRTRSRPRSPIWHLTLQAMSAAARCSSTAAGPRSSDRRRAVWKDLQPVSDVTRNLQLSENLGDVNSSRGCLGVGHENFIGGEQNVAQAGSVRSMRERVSGANGERGFNPADVRD